MTLSEIKELLRIVVESGVEEVEVEQEGTRIVVRRQGGTVTVQPAMPAMPYLPPMPYPPVPPMGYAPPVPP
jgi:acetyl-CoA carboxylase biotin carboxyl carrier protein